ncbi:MAG: LSM domain protein [Solobacterium sp.]|nr:LSM domain protein [Solobacterium sp.]
MKLRELFEKRVRVITCNDLIIIGKVIDYYPAIGTESGEDEIDIFPDGINHIIRLKESEIVAIEEIFVDSNS